jgi:hypothetical protein
MNRKALQKAIDALNVGTPDKICFALGILETLIENLPEDDIKNSFKAVANEVFDRNLDKVKVAIKNETPTDEASILDSQARIALEKFKTFNQTNNV